MIFKDVYQKTVSQHPCLGPGLNRLLKVSGSCLGIRGVILACLGHNMAIVAALMSTKKTGKQVRKSWLVGHPWDPSHRPGPTPGYNYLKIGFQCIPLIIFNVYRNCDHKRYNLLGTNIQVYACGAHFQEHIYKPIKTSY